MSEDDELNELRERRLAEMQRQQAAQAQQQYQQAQQAANVNAQIQHILVQILSSEARARLTNIKLARPEFAESIEYQLVQLFEQGQFRDRAPMSDQQFKALLVQIQNQSQKRSGQIKFK
jgi:programmed cell death protein 5